MYILRETWQYNCHGCCWLVALFGSQTPPGRFAAGRSHPYITESAMHPTYDDPVADALRLSLMAARAGNSMRTFEGWSRSEERRVGKECVSTCRSRWSPEHTKKETDLKDSISAVSRIRADNLMVKHR